MKKIFTLSSIIFFFTSILLGAFPLYTAHAEIGKILSKSAQEAEDKAYGGSTLGELRIGDIVGTLINGALGLLGTVFLVLLVTAGYHWMTAGGNEEDITQAKARIWQAVMGLIIVMAALLITQFVLQWLKTATTP